MRILTALAISAFFSAPVLAADLGMYRPGTPYSSSVAPAADVCESHCAGDAQCRAWNFVKPNPRVSGVCEFLSSVSTPIASQISISGEGIGGTAFSSRVSAGATNTVRVGTQVAPRSNTVTVGQTEAGRRIVREATPQRAVPQTASTRIQPSSGNMDPMSLTAQQNRFRQQGHPQVAQQPQPQFRNQAQPRTQVRQNPAFRPILDGPMQMAPQPRPQQMPMQPRRPQYAPVAQPQQRRMTGPRQVAPQQYAPQQMPTRQVAASRPPIGQAIPAPETMSRRSVIAPQSAPENRPFNPVALAPDQAKRSLFGRLNDDIRTAPVPSSVPGDMPIATVLPSVPVYSEPMEALAGGL